MTLPVGFLPEAESEVEAAYVYYEKQRPGLGLQFLLAFDAAVSRASENPRVFPRVARRTRKALLRRFPYLVFYVVEEYRILVTGVFHGHRDPGAWSDRVREKRARYNSRPQPAAAK